MTKYIIIFLLLINLEGEEMKKEIDFYKQGDLMWLIDATDKNGRYTLETVESIQKLFPNFIEDSYENYLNYVNNNESYQYSDWRVPTKDELLTLVQKDTFFTRLFTSSEKKKSEKVLDTDIFYDDEIRSIVGYWSSTKCSESKSGDGYLMVSFKALRFDQHSYAKGSQGSGVVVSCRDKGSKFNLRLVRDIK